LRAGQGLLPGHAHPGAVLREEPAEPRGPRARRGRQALLHADHDLDTGRAAAEGHALSLLLDALKRAEQEKLARQGGGRPESGAAPVPAPAPTSAALPRVAAANLELQPLSTPPGTSSPAARADAQAAQNVFQAKEAPTAKASGAAPARKGSFLWIA